MREFIEISPKYWRSLANRPGKQFVFDLQRFDSGEKTEEPTQRKKEESRKKGQVAKSAELSSVFVILAAFVAFLGVSVALWELRFWHWSADQYLIWWFMSVALTVIFAAQRRV